MNQIITKYWKTPYGELVMGAYQDQLCMCDWRYRKKRESIDQRLKNGLKAEMVAGESEVFTKTQQQLDEYFLKKRTTFELPLLLVGSDFQQTVWKALLEIPFGNTCSYLELSRTLKNEKAIRAVASANGANALSIVVPCHRIIGQNGDLIGYAGGLAAKKKLLLMEGGLAQNQLEMFG